MNRRGFLSRMGLALAAMAVAPAINLLAEEETICNSGLLWQIQQSGNAMVYDGNITMAMFDEVIKALDKQQGDTDVMIPISMNTARMMGLLN